MAKTRAAARRGKPKRAKSKRGTLRMLIVEARFYEDISDALLRGARSVLDQAGAEYNVITVPGALEIPAAIAMALDVATYDGVVALGCVIRGDTYHFEVVANESGRGLMQLALSERVALGNGILTVENEIQARARAGSVSNKGDLQGR
jgi:6,7-dimethyl-8-ribityllumazine synthase